MPLSRREVLLAAALAAHRSGRLAEGIARHPRAWRWAHQRWLAPVLDTAGTGWQAAGREAQAVQWLLAWSLSQLRPDRGPGLRDIPADAWIARTSWRPLLALASQHGFLPVPAFPERYRRRADESVLDNLCGLWAVGASTVYRYLDKGRQQLAALFDPADWKPEQWLSLRDAVQAEVDQSLPLADRPAWHAAQADAAQQRGAIGAALWHRWRSGDGAGLLRILQRWPLESANVPECDGLLARLDTQGWGARQRFDLALAQAGLWRSRQVDERENEAYAAALRIASDAGDPLMLGTVYGALGKFNESRDPDRAFACYEDSVEHLRRGGLQEGSLTGGSDEVLAEYAQSLIRLAWLHVRRSDPRARGVLERAQHLSLREGFPLETQGQLEQAWGEYWRCAGEPRRALEHKHRALNLFEQLGDQRSVLSTYINLSLIYGEVQDHERAVEYGQRVLAATQGLSVEPEVLLTAYGNLGVAHFWRADYDQAISCYRRALTLAEQAGMQAHASTTHYNLAEAHYKRFQQHADPEDERLGDHHATVVARIGRETQSPKLTEASQALKGEVLGRASVAFDRLLPEDLAAHYPQMAEVRRLQGLLALPCTPEEQVAHRLDLAQAFLAMAAEERGAVLALVQRHGLGTLAEARIDALNRSFLQSHSQAERLRAPWLTGTRGVLPEEASRRVLQHLLDKGSINKSAYAEVAGVSPATASKHLALLQERGLLSQEGKGPSTRYLLVAASV